MYAFASGIYNPWSAAEVVREVGEFEADIVHSHNVYPLFSPAIFRELNKHNIPVVLSLHNQQLTCPRADHLRNGKVCDLCLNGTSFNCAMKNCRSNVFESWAYAIRSQTARQFGLFRGNVTRFIALTHFAKKRLVQAGYDEQQIAVLPNMAPGPHDKVDSTQNKYFAFAGRLSMEKGIPTLLQAAEKLPHIRFRLAGSGPEEDEYRHSASDNVEFVGRLDGDDMTAFYRGARGLILPSTNYEMCPLVIGEAMSHGVPVIASDIGGIPELIEDGVTGSLFEPGHGGRLAENIRQIDEDGEFAVRVGAAGWKTARGKFGEARYLQDLTSIYEHAIDPDKPPSSDTPFPLTQLTTQTTTLPTMESSS